MMQRLRVGKAARVGDLTLIPLFIVETTCIEQPDILWLNATAEPYAVVFIELDRVQAVGIDAGELAVEVLVEQVPELDATIQRWRAC